MTRRKNSNDFRVISAADSVPFHAAANSFMQPLPARNAAQALVGRDSCPSNGSTNVGKRLVGSLGTRTLGHSGLRPIVLALTFAFQWANAQEAKQKSDSGLEWNNTVISKTIRLDTSGIVTFGSPNRAGTRLATVSSKVVTLFSLPSGRRERTYQIAGPFGQLAAALWSPNGQQLYLFSADWQANWCGVLDLMSAKVTPLPSGCMFLRSEYDRKPFRRLGWLNDSIVAGIEQRCGWISEPPFARVNCVPEGARRCNVFALTCQYSLPAGLQDSLLRNPLGSVTLLTTFNDGIQQHLFAAADGARWLALQSARPTAIVHLPSRPRTVFIGTNSGSWLIELSKGESGPLDLALDSTSFSAAVSWSQMLDVIEKGEHMVATAYPAQRNPLNNRVTGANTARTKASVRFQSVAGGRIVGRVLELYEPIRAGDVLGNIRMQHGPTRHSASGFPIFPRDLPNLPDRMFAELAASNFDRPATPPVSEEQPVSASHAPEDLGRSSSPISAAVTVGHSRALDALLANVRYADEFDRTTAEISASPTRVWEALIGMFQQSKFNLRQTDKTLLVLVAARSQNLLLFNIERTYYISLSADSAQSPTTRLDMKLVYTLVDKKPEPKRSPKDARREMQKTIENLRQNLGLTSP